jgi:hypothetical protein
LDGRERWKASRAYSRDRRNRQAADSKNPMDLEHASASRDTANAL